MSAALRRAVVRAPGESEGWWAFENPVESLVARERCDVMPLLERVEAGAGSGLWAVGCVSYEAAPGFDRALETKPSDASTLAAFGLFSAPRALGRGPSEIGSAELGRLEPSLDEAAHAAAVATIKDAIAAGETYQINLTFPMLGRLSGSPEALFWRLARASRAPYAAFLDLGARAIVSLSPELFFELDGERIVMRPMKGTRRRGRFGAEDEARARELAASPKDRAENLMIVDMARNDLGRIAQPGTVNVTSLCDVERYPTVWQMTSTVEARTDATLRELFGALFPCASVTGAPKPRSMRWIERLERGPRGVYCGSIGYVAPARRARFSVAIRTATVERDSGALAYGVGSGIVWDSEPAAEYDECLAKARALEDTGPSIALIETMRWTPGRGIRLLERHLARLREAAIYFDIPFDESSLRKAIASALSRLPLVPHRVRLELDGAGNPSFTSSFFPTDRRAWRGVLAADPVDSSSPFLFHKTNRREIYDRALAEATARGADEAILWNERGELTEGTRTNLFLRLDGEWLTPARDCGLLAGVRRAALLARGAVREAVVPREALRRADAIVAASALRGLIRIRLVASDPDFDRSPEGYGDSST